MLKLNKSVQGEGMMGRIAMLGLALLSMPAFASVPLAVDSSFGTSGVSEVDYAASSSVGAYATATDSVGRIYTLVGLLAQTEFLPPSNYELSRRLASGALDSSFGTGGILSLPGTPPLDANTALIVTGGLCVDSSSGNIFLLDTIENYTYAGSETPPPQTSVSFSVRRIDATGTAVASWGNQGTVSMQIPLPDSSQSSFVTEGVPTACKIAADGSLFVIGGALQANYTDTSYIAGMLAKFDASGSPDASFGDFVPGVSIFNPATSTSNIYNIVTGLVFDSKGNILVGGGTGSWNLLASPMVLPVTDSLIARFTSAGVLDTSFNSTGLLVSDFGGNDFALDLRVQADDKPVAVIGILTSDYLPAAPSAISQARFNGNGSVDASYGSGGRVDGQLTPPANLVTSFVTKAMFNPDGNLVASYGGTSSSGEATDIATQLFGFASSVATLTASPAIASASQPVKLTAYISGAAAAQYKPGGSVSFQSGATLLGTASVDSAGIATIAVTMPSGVHPVTAIYSGDGLYTGTSSKPQFVLIRPR